MPIKKYHNKKVRKTDAMNALKCSRDHHAARHFSVDAIKSVRKSPFSTETSSSTIKDSRRLLESNDIFGSSSGKNGYEVLHDCFNSSECSMLASDHESTKNAMIGNYSICTDDGKPKPSLEFSRIESIGGEVQYDDSFFSPCEVDVGSLEDSSSSGDDIQDCIPISIRGRSMSIEEDPKRRKNITSSFSPSKEFKTTQNTRSKNHSMNSCRASSLPPSAHIERPVEAQGKQSRFVRSKRRNISPRLIISPRGGDRRPDIEESRNFKNEAKEKPCVRSTSKKATSTKGDREKKGKALTYDIAEILIRQYRNSLSSRDHSPSNNIDNHASDNENISALQTKSKKITRRCSLQTGFHEQAVNTLADTEKRQSRRCSLSTKYDIPTEYIDTSNGFVEKDRKEESAKARRPIRTSSSSSDQIHCHSHLENHGDRSGIFLFSSLTVKAKDPENTSEMKGRLSRNRSQSMSSEMEELNKYNIAGSNMPVLQEPSSRRHSLEHHDRLKVHLELMAPSTTLHQFTSPQKKMSSLTSKITSEILIPTDNHGLFDRISPITLDKSSGIISYEYIEGKEALVKCDCDARWRTEAYHPSPRRPSRQPNASEQNARQTRRSITKYQSFPESPSRRSRTIAAFAQRENVVQHKPKQCTQPHIGKNQPCVASPLRHPSPVESEGNAIHQIQRSSSADDFFQRQRGADYHRNLSRCNNFHDERFITHPTTGTNSNTCSPTKSSRHRNFKDGNNTNRAGESRSPQVASRTDSMGDVQNSPMKRLSGNDRFL